MSTFIYTLRIRCPELFWFGLACLLLGLLCLVISRLIDVQVYGVNAYVKPAKFALSTWLYAWSIALYMGHLQLTRTRSLAWIVIVSLGFEIGYILWRASRGEESHFNLSSPLSATLFSLMALFATVATLVVGYIGLHYFTDDVSSLPLYYVYSIRIGCFLFVLFAFQGFTMGSALSHTIGAINDNSQIPILGWSLKYGDLRVAHFIGMHALQIVPLTSYYLLRHSSATLIFGAVYAALGICMWWIALRGLPFFRVFS